MAEQAADHDDVAVQALAHDVDGLLKRGNVLKTDVSCVAEWTSTRRDLLGEFRYLILA
jgi:hypothetical protein